MSGKQCSVDGCAEPHEAKGYCHAHYMRWRRHGDPLAGGPVKVPDESVEDRFRRYAGEPSEGCWEWSGALGSGGYGHFKLDGRMVKAHRWAYERYREPIPEGMVIDHMCHNRTCVNPDHLRVVTQDINAKNRVVQSNNRSGVSGVQVRKLRSGANSYAATVKREGKTVWLGSFATVEEAAGVAIAARQETYQLPDFAAQEVRRGG